ncbi:MAG: Gldg family protein, partial [Spirochaetota bacterium]
FFRRLKQDIQFLRNRRLAGKDILEHRSRSRRSMLALYSGLMFWGLLTAWVMLNLLASQYPAKWNLDASDDQIYSLSEASKKILNKLEEEVRIYALFSGGKRPTQPLDIYHYLELYAGSSPHITFEEVDPELEPQRIRPFITGKKRQGRGGSKAPRRDSLIIFRPGGRFRVLHYRDLYYVMKRFGAKNAGIRAEQQISSAIAYIDGARVSGLGLLTGHREQTLAAVQPNFEQFNMEVRNVQLSPNIGGEGRESNLEGLEDIDVLLVYKPQIDLSEQEAKHLRRYLSERSKAMWLILDFQAEYLPRFYQLAKDYGIEILEGLVLERDPARVQAASGYTTFVTPIRALPKLNSGPEAEADLHPIIRPLQDNKIGDLLWVQSMAVRESRPHPRALRFYALAESSTASLLRSSKDPSSTAELPDDHSGPLTLMGLSVWQNEQGKRSGPALLLSFDVPGERSIFTTPSNLQLFYSALSWLGAPSADNTPVFPGKSLLMLPMRLSQAQAIGWSIAFVILLPLFILLAGLLFLRHRKNL